MKKLTVDDIKPVSYGQLTIMLNRKNQMIEEHEISLQGVIALLKTSNSIGEVQKKLIESLKLTIKKKETEIEELNQRLLFQIHLTHLNDPKMDFLK